MPVCIIALGGNVGDVRDTFSKLCICLENDERFSHLKLASSYRTKAVGSNAFDSVGDGFFWNSAIKVETSLPALKLLDFLQQLEKEFGRHAKGDDSPRTLDLDIIFYGQEILSLPGLTVPHTACWYRRFVLDPICELAPEYFHPVKNVCVAQLKERLLSQPFRLGISGGTKTLRQHLCESLQAEFNQIEISVLENLESEDVYKQTIIAWLGRKDSSAETISFSELPLVSRLDLSSIQDKPLLFLKNVIHSALDS